MDSARDFDLLGESVPQVRVSARTLALLGFFSTLIYSDSLFRKISLFFEHLGGRCSQAFDCLPFERGKNVRAHLEGRCVKSTCNIVR